MSAQVAQQQSEVPLDAVLARLVSDVGRSTRPAEPLELRKSDGALEHELEGFVFAVVLGLALWVGAAVAVAMFAFG